MTSVQNAEHSVVAQWAHPTWATRSVENASGSVTHSYRSPVETSIDSEVLPIEQEPFKVEMYAIDAVEALDGFGVQVDRSPVRIQIGNSTFSPEQAAAIAVAVNGRLEALYGETVEPNDEADS